MIQLRAPWYSSEDWLAVWIGVALVAFVLLLERNVRGRRYWSSEFSLGDSRELFARVLVPRNLLLLLGMGRSSGWLGHDGSAALG